MLDDRSYMRDSSYDARWSATLILVVANTVVFAIQLIADLTNPSGLRMNPFDRYLALSPSDLSHGWIWQLLTFQFLHGGPLHLILNCAMLWIFGRPLEQVLGRSSFLKLYFISGSAGGLVQVACGWLFTSHFGLGPVLGASAGVFGLIAAFAALNWNQRITTLVAFIIPVTMKAKYLILVLGIIGLLGLLEKNNGIAHAAHLGGMLFGLAYTRYFIQTDHRFFNWSRLRPVLPRRELVKTSPVKRALWQKAERAPVEELPPAEFISREVDPILDKISAHGIQSLTDRERQILEKARAKMAKR
ncbi:MAG: rhomboid family intramembrane serine protease [Verrucomicrobiota bacterium]